jgi:uncharacterized protein (TIGR02118 family)
MESQPVIHMVAADSPPQQEEKFNQWYNDVHVPGLLKFKGLRGVTRYKILTRPCDQPQYLAVYQFGNQQDFEAYLKSPERAAAIEEMKLSWPQGLPTRYSVQYTQLHHWKK